MCAFGSFPRLGNFSAMISIHNFSVPFSLSSAFETPSILLTYSSRVRSFSENIFIKKKKKKEILVLSSHLPESFYLWTHALSAPYGLHFQCFAIHPSSHLLSSSAPKFLFKSFHYFRNCSYVHYFYSSANWSVFGSFLLACWASSWHYLEFSTCLITILQDVKLVHG